MGRGEDIKDSLLKDIKFLNDKVTKYVQELYKKEKELDNKIQQKSKELVELQKEEQQLKRRLKDLEFNQIAKSNSNIVTSTSTTDMKQLKSETRMWSINFLNNNTNQCPFCKVDLSFDDIFLARFISQAASEKNGFISTKSLFCEKCKRHFLSHTMRSEIQKTIGRSVIKENTSANNQNVTSNNNKVEIKRNLYKEEKENLDNDMEHFEALNLESQLHKLGYNVSKLNKDERWRVLIYRVLPKMSVEAIISSIEYNMRLRQGQSKFASAISAWRYDIQRLREYKQTGGSHGNHY